jgi:hypothetical protein
MMTSVPVAGGVAGGHGVRGEQRPAADGRASEGDRADRRDLLSCSHEDLPSVRRHGPGA